MSLLLITVSMLHPVLGLNIKIIITFVSSCNLALAFRMVHVTFPLPSLFFLNIFYPVKECANSQYLPYARSYIGYTSSYPASCRNSFHSPSFCISNVQVLLRLSQCCLKCVFLFLQILFSLYVIELLTFQFPALLFLSLVSGFPSN